MSIITTERLREILSETQAVISECNARCVQGSVEVDCRLFENVLMELLRRRAAMLHEKAEPVTERPELTVWYGSMPESNGKTNWTAILHRKGEGRCMDGFTIDRSEYPGRVLYAADRVRYLIGEKADRPSIIDYDADAHSGYVKPGNSPVIPDDVRRMEWLVSKTVDVREPMVYGSHSLFWSQTITDEEDDYHATKLREQIDAAMAAEKAAAPQQEVKP